MEKSSVEKPGSDKTAVGKAIEGEQQIALKYAELLGICGNSDLRAKLIYAQRSVNEATELVLDEYKNRGFADEISADKNTADKLLFS